MKAYIFAILIFLSGTLFATESIISKRYIVDKRLLGGSDLSNYTTFKGNFSSYTDKQPALMFEQNDLPSENTNYFTISGATQTSMQNSTILTLEAKGIIKLMDTLEVISENGQTVDSKHTVFYEPADFHRDWTIVEKSTDK